MQCAFMAPCEVIQALGISKSLFYRRQEMGLYRRLLHPNGRGHKRYSRAAVEAFCQARRDR